MNIYAITNLISWENLWVKVCIKSTQDQLNTIHLNMQGNVSLIVKSRFQLRWESVSIAAAFCSLRKTHEPAAAFARTNLQIAAGWRCQPHDVRASLAISSSVFSALIARQRLWTNIDDLVLGKVVLDTTDGKDSSGSWAVCWGGDSVVLAWFSTWSWRRLSRPA